MLASAAELTLRKRIVQSGGDPLDPRELTDVLWLAWHFDRILAPADWTLAKPAGQDDGLLSQSEAAAAPEPPAGLTFPMPASPWGASPHVAPVPQTPSRTLFGEQAGSDAPSQEVFRRIGGPVALGGEPVDLPEAFPIPDSRNLLRTLRPIGRRVRRGPATELDVEATAESSAENGGALSPLTRPPLKRWLTLQLVIDSSESMDFWEPGTRALMNLLSRSGLFADVRCWRLSRDSISVRAEAGGLPRPLETLLMPAVDQVVLLVTDGLGRQWRNGAAFRALEVFGAHHPTACLQLLPQSMWERTGFSLAAQRQASSPWPAAANRRLAIRGGDPWRREMASPFPVFTLDLSRLSSWADLLCGKGGNSVASIVPSPSEMDSSSVTNKSTDEGELPAERRLRRFMTSLSTSEEAKQLVRCFAAAPLSPAVMRLVQRANVPWSRHWHLAEVVFGSVVRPIQAPKGAPEPCWYDFHPFVRELLLDSMPVDDIVGIRLEVAKYLPRLGFGADRFPLWLENPNSVADASSPSAMQNLWPLAQLDREIFRRLGPRFERVVAQLDRESGAASERDTSTAAQRINDDRPETFTNSVGMSMVGIPSGTFIMGSPEWESGRESDASMGKETQHVVALTQPFRIAATPVTQEQWREVMEMSIQDLQRGESPSDSEIRGEGDRYPVYFVGWEDALRFCDWLTLYDLSQGEIGEEQAYTLPTEAQWEYACRAETEREYNLDGSSLRELGWFSANSPTLTAPEGTTYPVGEKKPNRWGLYDCHGNVWEWCADRFQEDLGSELAIDPQGPEGGVIRVLRGGSWKHNAWSCRSACRSKSDQRDRLNYVGFRPVLAGKEQRAKLPGVEPGLEAARKPEPKAEAEARKRNGPHGMIFVPVKAGTFTMGSPENEEDRYRDEDLHHVTLTQDFEIAETPVTQGQWQAVMGNNPSHFHETDLPVEKASWEDAVRFCAQLSADDLEFDYRLPTEAQWEYACRAGTSGPYNLQGAQIDELGWYLENAELKTHPVKLRKANALGLFDMHGNVLEWCQDWFTEYLGTEPVTDPQGPPSGDARVVRGGSWRSLARSCRSASRRRFVPDSRNFIIGFRPVRQKRREGFAQEAKPDQTLPSSPSASDRSPEMRARDFEVPVALGMKMVALQAGSFTMGDGEQTHPVTLSKDFFIAETPVTQAQWQALMGHNPSHFKQVGDKAPVESVSWDDAMAFCAKLNEQAPQQEGWEWALPTEAQWEYACRAGTTTAFNFGEALNGRQANCNGNYPEGTDEKGPYLQKTSSVKSYPANRWDIHDMHGNVWEWCVDWYNNYPKGAATDPIGPENGDSRVLRGGSWNSFAVSCRSAHRYKNVPDDLGNGIGFRPVLTRREQRAGRGGPGEEIYPRPDRDTQPSQGQMAITDDSRIESIDQLIAPAIVREEFQVNEERQQDLLKARETIERILDGSDDRLLVILGPCTIHDTKSALDYAAKLQSVAPQYTEHLRLVMRTCFEEETPRHDWRGLIMDPGIDQTFDVNRGLRLARSLLTAIANLGIPVGLEFHDLISPLYYADLLSWGVIGSSNTENPKFIELVSGLPMPVGFCNQRGGNVLGAVLAASYSQKSHHFLHVKRSGISTILTTRGNPTTHLVLRGGHTEEIYDSDSVSKSKRLLSEYGISAGLIVDCSHGNSRYDYRRQAVVAHNVAEQIASGERGVKGVMLESHLNEGNQQVVNKPYEYGISITDGCVSWEATCDLLQVFSEAVQKRRELISR